MNKKIITIVLTICVAIGFIVATKVYKNSQAQAQIKNSLFEQPYSPTQGNPGAKVVITEFFDPGCEACKIFSTFVKEMLDTYPTEVRVIFKYVPLHEGSHEIVAILQAAKNQNRFREALYLTYKFQQKIWQNPIGNPEVLYQSLSGLLDINQLKKDKDSKAVQAAIAQDWADATQLDIRQTPSFFINGQPLLALGIEELKDQIAQEVKKQYPHPQN